MCRGYVVNYDAGRRDKYVISLQGIHVSYNVMFSETLHSLRSERLVVHVEGVTSPDFVVNDKRVIDEICFAMHYVTSTKLQQNNRNKYPQDCRKKVYCGHEVRCMLLAVC
jgi:intein-encoded DNA endonuclease-like protein